MPPSRCAICSRPTAGRFFESRPTCERHFQIIVKARLRPISRVKIDIREANQRLFCLVAALSGMDAIEKVGGTD